MNGLRQISPNLFSRSRHLWSALNIHHAQQRILFLNVGSGEPNIHLDQLSRIGLLVLQVPLPFVNGLIAGISAFVPYLGAIASVVPPALLALLDFPWKAIEVLLLYFLIQQIEGNLITPIIMKQQVSLLPATTLALLTAFGTFFGVLGLFWGLPILVVTQIWIKEVLVKDVLDQWTVPQKVASSEPTEHER